MNNFIVLIVSICCVLPFQLQSTHFSKEMLIVLDEKDNKVDLNTIMNATTLDQWLTYVTANPKVISKGDKSLIQKRIRELCIDMNVFSRFMDSNPTYLSKSVLEVMGVEYVQTLEHILIYKQIFPTSSKEKALESIAFKTINNFEIGMSVKALFSIQKAYPLFDSIVFSHIKNLAHVKTFHKEYSYSPLIRALPDKAIAFVNNAKDAGEFIALFPNSILIDRFVDEKEKTLSRDEKLVMIEQAPGSQKLSNVKKSLIDDAQSLNECIEIAKACNDCREELAAKCIGTLETSSDCRRYLSFFGNTKYAPQVQSKYNEIMIKKAENLGDNINTEYPDFGPVISPDGSTMYFSRNFAPDGYGGEDIYVSKLDKYGEWTKAENIRMPLNNSEHNGVYSVSQDGLELFLHNDYEENGNNPSITRSDGKGWEFPVTQQIPNLKAKGGYHNGTLSIDGKYLLMSVKRNDSYGGSFLFWKTGGNDIYVIMKDSSGNWKEPKNLGPIINTEEEEGSVFIAADGQTIYFSSAGHGGYGEQDMFMSRRLDDTWTNWSKPVNLGSIINSSLDDDFYVIPAKGDFIYFSSDRDGYGKDDIFRIGLPLELRPKPVAVIKGNVISKKDNKPVLARVVYEDLESGIQLGSVNTNPITGEYQIILVSGRKYGITPIPISETSTIVISTNDRVNFSDSPNAKTGGNVGLKTGGNGMINNSSTTNPISEVESASSPNGNNTPSLTIYSKTSGTTIVADTNKIIIPLFSESQNIDLTDLKEYTVLEQTLVFVPIETGQSISLNNLFFETSSWILKKESFSELNRIVKILIENPSVNIEIGGHTDDKGSDETNRALSEKRAFEVYTYLISKFVSKERLIYIGYGESKPKVPNTNEPNRAINRRVELKIR